MFAFLISFLVAAGQILLLKKLIEYVTVKNMKKALYFFLIKLALYAAFISIVMLKYFSYLIYFFCGFAVGMPICAMGIFVYLTYFKKQ